MLSSLKRLAVAADDLYLRNEATLTETPSALTVSALDHAGAQLLLPLAQGLGWRFEIVDGAGEKADQNALTADYSPFILTVEKPNQTATLQVITVAGLKAFLLSENAAEVWEVATLTTQFSTMATTFLPWGSANLYSSALKTKSPRELVREHNLPPHAPADIRVWLLRNEAGAYEWKEPVFHAFADLSAQALMRSLAGEIKTDGSLVFLGPPYTLVNAPTGGSANELGLQAYNDLRTAAVWVYENSAEAEQRHGLFTAEFGRSHPPISDAAGAFCKVIATVLSGARVAYQLSLSDLTREAIKAQGDLRKAVVDDTAKLADNTRQVGTAVAAALATCIGLVAAKAGTATPDWVIQSLAVVVAVYVAAVIVSGWIYVRVQQDMREKWRSRLYRFVPEADYKAMVSDPAKKAEGMFWVAAVAGGIIAVLAVALVFLLPGFPAEPK